VKENSDIFLLLMNQNNNSSIGRMKKAKQEQHLSSIMQEEL
jgi:hypothetical protein